MMRIKEELRIPLTMLSINFLDKLKFKGSFEGKRFIFEKIGDMDEKGKIIKGTEKLKVYLWKDYLNFENTDKELIQSKEYTYTPEGIDEGLKFVEETNV